jgi:hypothetical protein
MSSEAKRNMREVQTKFDLISEKLINFVNFIASIFPDNIEMNTELAKYPKAPIPLVISTMREQWLPHSTDLIVDGLCKLYKIDVTKVNPVDLAKFKRYLDFFKDIISN